MSLNKVTLIGNLTREVELKHTAGGTAVGEMGLAMNRVYMAGEERREEVTYVDVVLWGRDAEVAAEYLKKGRETCIEGRLQFDQWEDKQSGQKRSKLRVVCEKLILLQGGGKGGNGGGESEGGNRSSGRSNGSSNGGGNGGYGASNRGGGAPAGARSASRPPTPPADPDLDDSDGDIPF